MNIDPVVAAIRGIMQSEGRTCKPTRKNEAKTEITVACIATGNVESDKNLMVRCHKVLNTVGITHAFTTSESVFKVRLLLDPPAAG